MIRIRRIAAHNFKQLQEVDLHLPEQGRFLIQGKNEAGKSTLFEAVFFGIFGLPLVTEMGTRRLDDLIHYGMEKARVELWLEARDHLYRIYRTIVRGKPNVWEMDIEGPNGLEEVRGNDPVNRRIVQELGFDGEALLNTCFVEQKKLEKLEGMSRAKREESLMKLLNLETMVGMENDFKVRGEDRLALQRCEQRYQLAQIQTELPENERQLAEVEGKLLFIDLQNTVESTLREQQAVLSLEQEIASLIPERDSLEAKVKKIEQLKEGMQALREIRGYLERVDEQRGEIERLEGELGEVEYLQREGLPAVERRLSALGLLRSRLVRLDLVQTLRDENERRFLSLSENLAQLKGKREQLQGERNRQTELVASLEKEAVQEQALTDTLKDFEVREALLQWLGAQGEALIPVESREALRQKREERDRLSRRFRVELSTFLGALLLLMIGYQVLPYLTVGFFLGAVGILATLAWRISYLWREQSRAVEELGRLEGERKGIEVVADRDRERGKASEEQLKKLEVPLPPTVEEAEKQVQELEEKIGHRTLEQVKGEHDSVREDMAQAKARLEEVEQTIRRLEEELAAQDEVALQEEERACRQAIEKAERIMVKWKAKAAEWASSLAVEPDLSAVQGLVGGLTVEAEQMRGRIEGTSEIKAQIDRRREGIESFWKKVQELYQRLQGLIPHLPVWSMDLTGEEYQSMERELKEEYKELGEDRAKDELEKLRVEISSKEGEKRTRVQTARQLLAEMRQKLTALELGTALEAEEPSIEELEGLLVKIQGLELGDETALTRERDQLRERVGYLRNQWSALEEALGLTGEVLDLGECRQAVEEKQRELAVRERAVRIVETARRRVVERVLPSTMEHMRQLLPILTMHRYYDAELTEEYRIRVWDERAGDQGDWKEKNIFSGGTKDQFSLALRLAFALATLPAERGAVPSFIFLDEPLGSFDDERAKALLYLLTETERGIASSFDQIFLISHVRVNPALFNYHIVLDGGRVVESDLPS
ncbi:MAG: AAA family ATPase [Anaerolineae bacterium]